MDEDVGKMEDLAGGSLLKMIFKGKGKGLYDNIGFDVRNRERKNDLLAAMSHSLTGHPQLGNLQ